MSEGTALCLRHNASALMQRCVPWYMPNLDQPRSSALSQGGSGPGWDAPLAVGVWRSFAHAFTDDVGAASGNRTRGSSLEG